MEKIREINKVWYNTANYQHDEESTKIHFIYPLFEALGWNLTTDMKKEINRIDCVLYWNNKPYIGVEAKSLRTRLIEEDTEKEKYNTTFNKNRLLNNCRNIGIKWAVVTSYVETLVFDVENEKKVTFYKHPNEYEKRFYDLKILKKPS